jgi:hypothetical protein
MRPAVKSAVLVFVCGIAAVGCASTCPAPARAEQAHAPAVSTTRLTSSDLAETDFAPLVGKQQHSQPTTDEEPAKDARPAERHVGGGFSGYK